MERERESEQLLKSAQIMQRLIAVCLIDCISKGRGLINNEFVIINGSIGDAN